MPLANRFVGEINAKVDTHRAHLDLPELVWRLLLTDTVILKTHRLLELRGLLACFGTEGLLLLLESGKLRLTCEAFALAFRTPDDAEDEHDFQFLTVWEKNRDEYVANALGGVAKLTFPDAAKAANAIVGYIEQPSDHDAASLEILSGLRARLLEGSSLVRQGISLVARQQGFPMPPDEIFVHAEHRGPSTYRITAELPEASPRGGPLRRDTLARGILGVAGIYKRIHEMRRHNALSGTTETDLPILDSYLGFLEHMLDPDAPIAGARRVVELTAAPVVSKTTRIDAKRLVDASRSPECLEFRKLLADGDTLSDRELVERLSSIGARFGVAAAGNVGRGIRWLASTLTAALPDSGVVSGPALGLLDAFVIDKVIKPRGPAVFLNRIYPSIFDGRAG